MTATPSPQPIFIHALFRTGSTYMFEVFRRLGSQYTCFQEPLHEIALHAKTDTAILDDPQDSQKANVLRHPPLSRSYFSELFEVADACLPHLQERGIYDGYFGTDTRPRGIDYWQSLIGQAAARPVIQECRSAGRIEGIKHQLGGHHVYLWRNPWDQWWSYQVSPYFDLTTQLIFNASSRPPLVQLVSEHIGFQPLPVGPLDVAYDHFSRRLLSPDHAYQAFYTLWLLGLHQGCKHADQLVNIDQLSANATARRHAVAALERVGVSGLSLDDCHSPVSSFTDKEQARFNELEQDIHQLWIKAGLPESDLQRLLTLRQKAAPERHALAGQEVTLANELSRYRDLLRRRHEEILSLHQQSDAKLQTAHRREDVYREQFDVYKEQIDVFKEQIEEAAQKSDWLERQAREQFDVYKEQIDVFKEQIEEAAQKSDWLERQAQQHKSTAEDFDRQLNASQQLLGDVLQSSSWRLTAPLRKSALVIRRVPGVTGLAGVISTTSLRGTLQKNVSDIAAATDRRTRRHPRLRQALLALVLRMPWLVVRLRQMRRNPQSVALNNPVSLTPRSRDIYRQLVAAIGTINTQNSSKDKNETPD
jgi:precorrin-2 methylase